MKNKLALGLGLLALMPAAFAQSALPVLPNELFLVVHFVSFLLGLFLFWKATKWQGGLKKLALIFLFFAIAEIIYVGAHLAAVPLYDAHVIGEVLLFIGALVAVAGVMKK